MHAARIGVSVKIDPCTMTALCLTLVMTLLLAVRPATAQQSLQARLVGSDSAVDDTVGVSVAMDGDTAIFGAIGDNSPLSDAGSAYVFLRNGGVLAEEAKLTASDAAAGDFFGNAVAISGDTAIVGAFAEDNAGGVNAGSAYVFVRTGAIWSFQAKLTASDGAESDFFGVSVALDGDTAIVGAYGDDHAGGDFAGSAYVFVRSGTVWTQQAKLIASDAADEDGFGASVALSGNTAVVGSPDDDHSGFTRPGSAYVFVRSGTVWTEQAKLTANDAADFDVFGTSVAIDGDTAIAGAQFDDEPGLNETGSVYVFVRSGTIWTQQARLVATVPVNEAFMGRSVAIDGNRVVAGAHNEEPNGLNDAGAAHVFVRSGTSWSEQATFIANDPTANEQFGFSVAVAGDTALIGAPSVDHFGVGLTGAAYMVALADFNSCPTDTNGDGVVGVPDLLKVINTWGPCPP